MDIEKVKSCIVELENGLKHVKGVMNIIDIEVKTIPSVGYRETAEHYAYNITFDVGELSDTVSNLKDFIEKYNKEGV